FRQTLLQHFGVEHARLIANVIHGAEGAAVVAGTHRGKLHVEGIDFLGLFPVISHFEQLCNARGVVGELVAVNSVYVCHKWTW
ncbi:MAG: hypothetical protein AAB356_06795, partial [Deltaproteobacteria bacterium]